MLVTDVPITNCSAHLSDTILRSIHAKRSGRIRPKDFENEFSDCANDSLGPELSAFYISFFEQLKVLNGKLFLAFGQIRQSLVNRFLAKC